MKFVFFRKFQSNFLIIIGFLTVSAMLVILTSTTQHYYSEVLQLRKAELMRLVEVAHHSIRPVITLAETGQLNVDKAQQQAAAILRRMTFSDEYGENYIFMSSYDGKMLVQPFEPQKEGSNQWNLRDAQGNYVVRKLAAAAQKEPDGSFVSYYYFPPGSRTAEEKLSYVIGINALQAYIGTGMYMQSSFRSLNRLLHLQQAAVFASFIIIITLLLMYLKQMKRDKTGLQKEIAEKEVVQQLLFLEKELLEATFSSIGDGAITTDIDGKILRINRAAEKITGWNQEEAVGKPLEEVFRLSGDENGFQAENPIKKAFLGSSIKVHCENALLLTKTGRKVAVSNSTAMIKDKNGKIYGVVLIFRDITAEKEQQEKILYLSYHDSLTGLYNRRYMEEEIKRLEQARIPVAVIAGDVNGLKLTNDVFGHAAGDKLLKTAAEILKSCCRSEDIISRWGGDEFLLLLPGVTANLAEEIVLRIKNKCSVHPHAPLQVSIAMGFAVKKGEKDSLVEAIKEAEEWMYRHKLLESKSYRNSIINTLLATLFEKSKQTEGHAERLKQYCLKIGEKLRLSSKELDELALLAVLHDIGKVGISDCILHKAEPLTPEEWEIMKRHPEIGFRIAQNTPELSGVSEYILSHHERWDGLGYPRGLKGEEIPLLARILAVADAYDAMTNNGPHRIALSSEEALSELIKGSGTQFDPEAVKLFLKVI